MKPKLRERYEHMLKEAKRPMSGCSEGFIARIEQTLSGEKPIFSIHQYETLGPSEWEIKRQEEAKRAEENVELLNKCHLHDFNIRTDGTIFFSSEWQCANCEGIVNENEKIWYEKGLAHANKQRLNVESNFKARE